MSIQYNSIRYRFICLILLVFLCYPACRPKTVPFAVVREADFRVGPVDLPLNDEGHKKITDFLLKGGDNNNPDIVAADAAKTYEGLFLLLADSDFLHRSKFREEGKIGKISQKLEQWFEKTIVYSLIDAQNKRPYSFAMAPISLNDKNGKYWWIFYLQPPAEFEEDPKIIKVLVTVTPIKNIKKN